MTDCFGENMKSVLFMYFLSMYGLVWVCFFGRSGYFEESKVCVAEKHSFFLLPVQDILSGPQP